MDHVVRSDDFQVDIGRASGGQTFVRVVHLPTGESRQAVGLAGRASSAVIADLCAAVEGELLGACRGS